MQADHDPSEMDTPVIQSTRRRLLSPVWLIPLLAIVVALGMGIHSWLSIGPSITVSFQSASGLEAGKTPVKYKDVIVGLVKEVTLSEDNSHVEVTISLANNARRLARAGSRFWVVRPHIGSSGVSGIDTLLSGAYIMVDSGTSTQPQQDFVGLETPPTVINGTPGHSFVLHANDPGSLDIGSPVYYHHIQVGRIASFQLDAQGDGVNIQTFINAPYDRLVGPRTRFWNASGMDISLGTNGLKVNTQSLATIMVGGIAFDQSDRHGMDEKTRPDSFTLYKDRDEAMAPDNGPVGYMQLRFDRAAKGLEIGAPVYFTGIEFGKVVSLDLDFDPVKRRFPMIVGIQFYPMRLGKALKKLPNAKSSSNEIGHFVRDLVDHGLRAQLSPSNLLTGQLYISIDFVRNAPKVAYDPGNNLMSIPTISDNIEKLQYQISDIVNQLHQVPYASIGRHLDQSLTLLGTTLKNVNQQIIPETRSTLQQTRSTLSTAQTAMGEDSPLQQNILDTLNEVQRTAKSFRQLTELLGRNPDALLLGVPQTAPDKASLNPASKGGAGHAQ
jgi:paraquat-inducible protein B